MEFFQLLIFWLDKGEDVPCFNAEKVYIGNKLTMNWEHREYRNSGLRAGAN
jgi:hypothetical protein